MERDMENKNILPANPEDSVPELKILCQKAVDLIDRARNTAIREVNLVQLLTYYTLGKWRYSRAVPAEQSMGNGF